MMPCRLSCSPENLEAALGEAEAICADQGTRMTPVRRRVLELLLSSDKPAKAYDLLQDLGASGAAKPPTIYRALDFLLEMGLAHKIESLNAFVACGHTGHRHAAAFLICDTCRVAQELHANDTFASLEKEASGVDFTVRNVVIEVRGLCANCLKAA